MCEYMQSPTVNIYINSKTCVHAHVLVRACMHASVRV